MGPNLCDKVTAKQTHKQSRKIHRLKIVTHVKALRQKTYFIDKYAKDTKAI